MIREQSILKCGGVFMRSAPDVTTCMYYTGIDPYGPSPCHTQEPPPVFSPFWVGVTMGKKRYDHEDSKGRNRFRPLVPEIS